MTGVRRRPPDGPERRPGPLAPLAAGIGSSVCAVALLAVSGWLITRAAEHPPVLYLLVAVVAVRAFGLFRGVLRYLERLTGHRLGLDRQARLRVDVWEAMTRRSWIGRRGGDLLARVVADVAAVQDRVVRVLVPAVAALVTLALGVLLAAAIVPVAGLWLLGCLLVGAVLVPLASARWSARADAGLAALRGEATVVAAETATAAAELAVLGRTDVVLARLAAVDDRIRRAERRRAVGTAVAAATQFLSTGAAVAGALVIGAGALAAGRVDGPLFALLVLLPLGLHDVMATLPAAWQTRSRVRAALGRVDDLLIGRGTDAFAPTVGAPTVGERSGGAGALEPADPGVVRLRDLTVGWSGRPVLTGLDVDLGPGRRLGIIGPSGSGKSTLAATLLGLTPPLAGTAAVGGPVGYLAQDAHLFDTTVAENLRIGRRDADDAAVAAALAAVGLDLPPDRLVGRHGVQVSGGEARRIALARLLLRDDPVLVLDEPTDQLDAPTARALLDTIDRATRGRTVIVIGHDPALFARCDAVLDVTAHAVGPEWPRAAGADWAGGPDRPDRPLPHALVAARR
ncbi:thiol reductant ABC exporter CydC subunit [Friedmanniella endophytica]|uniref:Thiol reductant ABC exporter CydC subunit n=1 Tax=Microlunatus kandeliicorticis TaxID=1759536 RepID=A0A7W3P4Y0_9ACTN|nr:thiol reductant ABC exporter subunit CydC [Microlunatus kandeliicorticis]MBA8793381.1 thiol reductant ABC exporter CydC subunit [Microlunatus kandeliicorticis]